MTSELIVWCALLASPTVAALFMLGDSPSRRWLGLALACGIPVLGPVLAVITARTRGSESATGELERRDRDAPPPPPCAAQIRRHAELPPLVDRLVSPRPATRIAALSAISVRADEEAVGLLRWTIEHGGPEAVLDAALTLEDLDVRRERLRDETSRAANDESCFESELAAAEASASGVLTGLADPAVVPVLADAARAHYRRAVECAPTERPGVERALARLELAAGRPRAALDIIARLRVETRTATDAELDSLWTRALFAARVPYPTGGTVCARTPHLWRIGNANAALDRVDTRNQSGVELAGNESI